MDGQRVEARLKALFQIAHSLSSSMKVNELLSLILIKSQEVMNAEGASLLLRVPGTDLLEFVNVTGNASGFLKEKRIAFGEGVSGEVARSKTMMNIPNAYNEPRFNSSFDEASGFRTREILALPLMHQEQVVGVLSVINHKSKVAFSKEDEAILSLFSDQATVALVRALERKRSDQRSQSLKVLTQETARILSNELTLTYAHCHRLRKDFAQNLSSSSQQMIHVEAIEKSADALSRITKTLQAHASSSDIETNPESFTFKSAAKMFAKETHFHEVKVFVSKSSQAKAFLMPLESVLLSVESLLESLANRFALNQLPPQSTALVIREREGYVDFCVSVNQELLGIAAAQKASSQNLLSRATVSALIDSLGGELLSSEEVAKSQSTPFASDEFISPDAQSTLCPKMHLVDQIIMPAQVAL
jgi:signal transduction protein with GAF and PtsI domain